MSEEKNYCRCGCGTEIPPTNHKGRPRLYAIGHNPRQEKAPGVRETPPTREEVEAARKKKLNNWRNIPDGHGKFPEFMQKRKCNRHTPTYYWLGDVNCPRCDKSVEKTKPVHFEHEEADWSKPFSEAGMEYRKQYEQERAS